MVLISGTEREYIIAGVEADIRNDGRQRLDYRPFVVETGTIPQATSSARVKLGDTDVVVGVKVDLAAPAPTAPNSGVFRVSVERSPSALSDSEGRRASEDENTALARALERVIGPNLPLDKLGLIPGQQCWHIYLDVLFLNVGGNLLDAAALAARAALLRTRLPKVNVLTSDEGETGLELVDDEQQAQPLDASRVPVIISLVRLGVVYAADPSMEEEACAGARVSVAVSRDGSVSVLKGGHGALDSALLSDMLARAGGMANMLFDALDAALARPPPRRSL